MAFLSKTLRKGRRLSVEPSGALLSGFVGEVCFRYFPSLA
jgi:hypothetical protein